MMDNLMLHIIVFTRGISRFEMTVPVVVMYCSIVLVIKLYERYLSVDFMYLAFYRCCYLFLYLVRLYVSDQTIVLWVFIAYILFMHYIIIFLIHVV